MLLIREVFLAKYGRGDELLALLEEEHQMYLRHNIPQQGRRVLTDASGRFFTIVLETVVDDFAAWQQIANRMFAIPEFGLWFERMIPLMESGSREFYNIVKQAD